MKFIYNLLLLFAATSGSAKETTASIEIIQPLDQTRYVGENSTLVIDAISSQVDTIIILQDDNKTTTVEVKLTKKTYCKTIKLHVGDNKISVSSYKDGKLIDTAKRNFYFLSELFEGISEDAAQEYKLRYFHTDKKENKCKSCHNMTSNIPAYDKVFEDITKTTCYECHKSLVNTNNTHAPTANWLCTSCHDGKFGEYNMEYEGASKYLAADPIAKTCASCHDQVGIWQTNQYGHGPVNDGRCERCHNPHGSDNEFFLRKNIWDICVTCHAEKENGKHVIPAIGFGRVTKSGGHPTRDRQDPARPGREFTCTSCHNPHGSSGIFLLRMKGSMPFNVCQRCHKK